MIAEIAGGIAVAGLATWAGFESMWPTLHAYGRSFIGLPPGTRQLALTYDDGPNDPCTLQLIEVLARHDVKATFFVLGKFVEQKPDIVRALVAAGHVTEARIDASIARSASARATCRRSASRARRYAARSPT
jgi:peptidoglycan/xylan/chitin deacetylase (PgdA/CDA1 family)